MKNIVTSMLIGRPISVFLRLLTLPPPQRMRMRTKLVTILVRVVVNLFMRVSLPANQMNCRKQHTQYSSTRMTDRIVYTTVRSSQKQKHNLSINANNNIKKNKQISNTHEARINQSIRNECIYSNFFFSNEKKKIEHENQDRVQHNTHTKDAITNIPLHTLSFLPPFHPQIQYICDIRGMIIIMIMK
mmetsp:Transcript_25067/g.28987  ORF Transcript_25067/g.28987 Transcript_25067/m.28987 type:complete len:187 (-) Transcript_25067:86-646(-)